MPENNIEASSGLKLTALSLTDVARVLSRAGNTTVTEETLRQDIEAGAPCNPDGTMNLVFYVAWLVREVANAD